MSQADVDAAKAAKKATESWNRHVAETNPREAARRGPMGRVFKKLLEGRTARIEQARQAVLNCERAVEDLVAERAAAAVIQPYRAALRKAQEQLNKLEGR